MPSSPTPSLPALTPEQRELYELLVSRGWDEAEADAHARLALDEAAEEDGYDGP